jgi:fatty-acyl-CoA synthase
MSHDLLWPRFASPDDVATIELIPLSQRGLPNSTFSVVERAATLWPDRTAVSVLPSAAGWQEPARRTFAELLSDVIKAANVLHSVGVRRDSAVALMSPNCEGLITATLAAQLAGIAAPINSDLSTEHVTQLLQRSGARVLIAAAPGLNPHIWTRVQHLVEEGLIDTVLLLRATGESSNAPAPTNAVRYLHEAAADHDGTNFAGTPPDSNDLAALFHTGGTTGLPKLAAHTHANEVANAWMIASVTLLDHDSVIFAALPMFHVNALIVTVLAPLLRGQQTLWAGPLGYREPALYGNFWKIVQKYRISAMSAVPTVYATLSQCAVDADITTLRCAMVGASALPPSVRKDFEQRTGVPLVEGYGLTEATCASARSFPDHPRPDSVGQRLPYQRMKTVHVDTEGVWYDCKAGEVGHVAITGPTVFPGYVVDHGEDGFRLDGLGQLVDGWLDTGDLGRVDDDGFVHLGGRAKDLIIRGGHNIDPAVIEEALLGHPDVTAAAAVARPDRYSGEVPVAFVTVRVGSKADAEQLRCWATDRIFERAAIPRLVTIVDAIPVTAVGKPYKLSLHADAARSEIKAALNGIDGVKAVDAAVTDGSILITVSVTSTCAADAVRDVLDKYALVYTIDLGAP